MKEDNCGYVIYFVATRPYITKAICNEIFYILEEAISTRDSFNKAYEEDGLFKVYRAIVSVDKGEVKHP